MESTDLETTLHKLEWACRYNLSVKRFRHVERVIAHSRELAHRFGVDHLRVVVAAAGHDMARELAPDRMVELADRYEVPQEDPLREHPILLHGPVAAGIMAEEYGVGDRDILEAVYHHTLGSANLTDIGKVLYVADYTEPGRPRVREQGRDRFIRESLNESVAAVIVDAAERFGDLNERTRSLYDVVASDARTR